jgi:hypothetical protein
MTATTAGVVTTLGAVLEEFERDWRATFQVYDDTTATDANGDPVLSIGVRVRNGSPLSALQFAEKHAALYRFACDTNVVHDVADGRKAMPPLVLYAIGQSILMRDEGFQRRRMAEEEEAEEQQQ